MRETWVRSLGWEDPLEKEMATHSSTLTWEIPWRSPVGYRPRGRKESDKITTEHTARSVSTGKIQKKKETKRGIFFSNFLAITIDIALRRILLPPTAEEFQGA